MLLSMGDRGDDVRQLVDRLRKIGYPVQETDQFNASVRLNVQAFQAASSDASGNPLSIDGRVGPQTAWAIEATLGLRARDDITVVTLPPPPSGGTETGRFALAAAMLEAKHRRGEVGSDNRGPDVARYLNGIAQEGQSWCAGFVSYCFQQALGRKPVFGYLVGAQEINNRMHKLGFGYPASLSNPPQPGDIIVWRRADPARPDATAWRGHVGIVHSFSDGILWTVEGNRGPFPSRVRPFRYAWSELVSSLRGDRFKGLYGLSRHP